MLAGWLSSNLGMRGGARSHNSIDLVCGGLEEIHNVLHGKGRSLPVGIMHPLEKGSNLLFPAQQDAANQQIVDMLKPRKEGVAKIESKRNLQNVAPNATTGKSDDRSSTILLTTASEGRSPH